MKGFYYKIAAKGAIQNDVCCVQYLDILGNSTYFQINNSVTLKSFTEQFYEHVSVNI